MKLSSMPFEGFYEEVSGRTADHLRIVVPERDLERDLISWVILPVGETVEDDDARLDYVFHYTLGDHLGNGLFVLRVVGRDASGIEHGVEIAAALTTTISAPDAGGWTRFLPMWFISKRLHFRRLDEEDHPFPGTAYGRLRFRGPEALPQRRLFGATV